MAMRLVWHALSRRGVWRIAVAGGLAVAMATAYLLWRDNPLPGAIEGQTLTWRFQTRGPIAAPDDLAILAIDDATMTVQERWPIPRQVLADAVEKLRAAGVRVIGVDLLLTSAPPSDESGTAGDRALAAGLAALPAVLPIAFTFEAGAGMDPETVRAVRDAALPIVHRAAGPAPALGATGALIPPVPLRAAASLGHVNVLADEDGVLRQIHLAVAVGGRHVPAFPVEVARHARALPKQQAVLLLGDGLLLGETLIPTDAQLRLPLFYYGPPKTIPTYSMADLLADRIPAGQLAGRAVLIGATATGAGDTFVTPFSRSLPGVEALATAAANMLGGQVLRRTTAVAHMDLVLIVGFGVAAFALGHLPSPVAAAIAVAALTAALTGVAQWAFQHGLVWLNLTFPIIGILLNAGLVAVGRTMLERRGRRDMERQKANLSRYHSPLIADLLAQERPDAAERRQMAAIVFIDMAGFTARCERLAPEAAARFLREFHGRIERAVLAHGGMLDQFLGDGAMVIFGVRKAAADDPAAALACARQLVKATETWSRRLAADGETPLTIRIGIHYGPVAISRLGGSAQLHFSAAGDTVNVAARLESLTRSPDSTITVSAAVVEAVRQAGRQDLLADFTELPPQPIRGRAEKLPVWTWHHLPMPTA